MDKDLLGTQLKDLFESWGVDVVDPYKNGYSNAPKQPSPRASFPDDPLALSCASYRLYKQDPHRRFTNIDSVNAIQEDRIQAQAIREYYNQRYTMRVLKGGQLTEYQQKTAQFLSGLHHLTTDELGLLYKLPYFYTEDTAKDFVVESTQSYNRPLNRTHAEYTLTPVKEIFRTRKGGEMVQFWYRDQDNHAVLIDCRATDNLLTMLRGLFKQPEIRVQTYTKMVGFDGPHEHRGLKLFAWSLTL